MIEQLEQMWHEKLIEDLFGYGPKKRVKETLDRDEDATTNNFRIHTITPNAREFDDTSGDQLAGEKLRESLVKDLLPSKKEFLAQGGKKGSKTSNLVAEIEKAFVASSKPPVGVKTESSKVKIKPEPPGAIEERDSQFSTGETSKNPITLQPEEGSTTEGATASQGSKLKMRQVEWH